MGNDISVVELRSMNNDQIHRFAALVNEHSGEHVGRPGAYRDIPGNRPANHFLSENRAN